MLNAITPLNRAPRSRYIAPTQAKQKASQTKGAPAIKEARSQATEYFKLRDLKASYQERPLDDILAEFQGANSLVQFPLGDKAIVTIKEQLLSVRKFQQKIQTSSVAELKELISSIKQVLHPSSQTSSDLQLQEKSICQLLAIANRVFPHYFKFEPYHVQILAVLGILAPKANFKGCLAQIKTGEGKSTIVALLALILACQGKCIDVITSTEYLSKRDEEKYKPFFKFFEITTSHICDKPLTPDHFSGQIVYGTNYNFEFSILFDKFHLTANRTLYNDRSSSRPFHVAIVDEVDNMLLDKASNSARIAYSSQKNLTALYPNIYDYVKDYVKKCSALKTSDTDIDIISKLVKQYKLSKKELVEQYKLSDKQLRELIDSAYRACFTYKLDVHYCLTKQTENSRQDGHLKVVIIDQDTGRLSGNSRWQHGLHQFLEYKHRLPIEEETLTLGALSHPAFFAYYKEIYGVTGSLGTDIERDEVSEMYNLTSFDVPTHKPPLAKQLPTIICNKEQETFNSALLREVLNTIKDARPCLILCHSIAMSKILHKVIEPKFSGISDIRLLNDVQNEDEDFLIGNAGNITSITIATNAAGRGTDIAISEKAAKNGGLHVIFTFFPNSKRVEIQGAGRAGRQGNPGSYRIIVPHDDALLLKTGGKKIEELIALRKKMATQESLARRQYAAINLAQHHILERFWNDFQNTFSTSLNKQAILNKWAEFYTDLENVEVNLEHHLDTALLTLALSNYENEHNDTTLLALALLNYKDKHKALVDYKNKTAMSNYRKELNSLFDHFMDALR